MLLSIAHASTKCAVPTMSFWVLMVKCGRVTDWKRALLPTSIR